MHIDVYDGAVKAIWTEFQKNIITVENIENKRKKTKNVYLIKRNETAINTINTEHIWDCAIS